MSTAKPSSFRVRLALQTMLVAGVVIAGFGAWAWWFARGEQARNHDLRIAQEARRLWIQFTPRYGPDEITGVVKQSYEKGTESVAVTVVWHSEGNPAVTVSGPEWEGIGHEIFLRHLPEGSDVITRETDAGERQARARLPGTGAVGGQRRPIMPEIRTPRFFNAAGWRFGAFSNPHYTLFVGFSEADLEADSRSTALWFAGAGFLALAIAGLGAWWASGRAIRPLRRIVETSGRMSAGNLEVRIPLRSGDDREFVDLIAALNDMTERLQESFARSARFTADASHELRTPLAVMQNTLNETLRSDSLDEGARESIGIVLHQASRLKHITHSLLLLSQADAGELPVRRERYNLSDDLEGLMEDAESLCGTAGLAFEKRIEPGLFVEADRALMHQVLQNLVSNAVKHNQPNGEVSLSLTRGDTGVRFEITNTSGEVDEEAKRRLFDRFYRAEASRRGEGFGLGLNIAHELARANGARLELISAPRGIISFSVTFAARHQGSSG